MNVVLKVAFSVILFVVAGIFIYFNSGLSRDMFECEIDEIETIKLESSEFRFIRRMCGATTRDTISLEAKESEGQWLTILILDLSTSPKYRKDKELLVLSEVDCKKIYHWDKTKVSIPHCKD